MFERLKAFFKSRLNESGALPAIMAGCILISATAVILAGLSVTVTRNAELNSVKTNVNYYLNSCVTVLEKKALERSKELDVSAKKDDREFRRVEINKKMMTEITTGKCNYISGTAESVNLDIRFDTSIIPTTEKNVDGVNISLKAVVKKGIFKGTAESTKYIKYPPSSFGLKGSSYIQAFDSNGEAVWVTPNT